MGYLLFTLIALALPTFVIARHIYQKQGRDRSAKVLSAIVFILIYLVMVGTSMTLFSLAGAFGR